MRKPRVVKFPNPKIADDTRFIQTLVWVLEQARAGKIKGYAMIFDVDQAPGPKRSIEAADVVDHELSHHLLGMIRRMEGNFIERQWPKEG